MTRMEMQPLQAAFASQDQAESVIRKLSFLRGDRFRLERADGASGDLAGNGRQEAEFGSDLGASASSEFTLSVLIPTEAADQARTVIRQAGGELY